VSSRALDTMRKRAHEVRTRAAIRRWSYRQRNLAAGVWFRLRRVLAGASAAYAITDGDARRLVAEGYQPEPCGLDLAPEKTILFVDEARLSAFERRPIPLNLGPEFLAAQAIALTPFSHVER
jgi:hypothetical protein